MLSHKDSEVCGKAREALKESKDKGAAELFIAALKSEDYRILMTESTEKHDKLVNLNYIITKDILKPF